MSLESSFADSSQSPRPDEPSRTRRLLIGLLFGNLLAVAVLAVLAGTMLSNSRERFRERAALATDNLAHTLGQALATRIDLIDHDLQSLGQSFRRTTAVPLSGQDATIHALLAEQQHLIPEVDALRLFDSDGHQHPHGDDRDGTAWQPALAAFLQARDATHAGLHISEPVYNGKARRWVLLLSRRLSDSDGRFVGVAQAEVAVERFRKLLATADVGPDGAVSLRTRSLRLVARHTAHKNSAAPVGSNQISDQLRRQMLEHPAAGTYIAVTAIDGIERANSYATVPGRPLIVLVGLGTADFLAPWQAQVWQTLALSGLLTLTVLGASLALYLAWRREAATARELQTHRDQLERLVAVRTAEVHASESRLRAFMTATPATTWIKDAAGRVTYANAAWEKAFGLTPQSWAGRTTAALLPERLAKTLQAGADKVRLTGQPVESIETTSPPDGPERHWQAVQFLLPDQTGVEQVAGIAIDITRQVRAEAERAAALVREHALRDAAERQAQHLREILHERDEFVRVLAHEVRQPLNNASAALESATAELAPGARREPGQAMQRVRRAQGVIRQIVSALDNTLAATALLTSAECIGRHDTDVDVLIELSLADLDATQRERVRVERIASTRTASMDSGLMRLALRNVLTNALLYSPPETTVVLRVTDSDEPLALVFEVFDTGSGVSDALLPRLFERGVRGTQEVPGHGIGLYVVRRAMELHGGTVDLRPNHPAGTVFRLWLPQDH